MKVSSIYVIENLVNGKVYVGFTSKSPNRRWKDHKKPTTISGSNQYIHRAMRKYGVQNFRFTVIYQSIDREHTLSIMEPYFIEVYKSRDTKHGYNMTDGGDGVFGRTHSEETRRKIGNKSADRTHSEQTKEAISKTLRETGNTKRKYVARWEDGRIEEFIGLADFCSRNGLSLEMAHNVKSGKASNHRGLIALSRT